MNVTVLDLCTECLGQAGHQGGVEIFGSTVIDEAKLIRRAVGKVGPAGGQRGQGQQGHLTGTGRHAAPHTFRRQGDVRVAFAQNPPGGPDKLAQALLAQPFIVSLRSHRRRVDKVNVLAAKSRRVMGKLSCRLA